VAGIACTAVLLFFSGLAQFAFLSGIVASPPTYFIVPFLIAGAVIAIWRTPVKDQMGWALVAWAALYILISVLGVLQSNDPQRSNDMLRHRMLCVAFLFAMRALCGSRAGFIWSLRAVAAVEIASIGLNVYEWFTPLAFSSVYGRAAGLYQNPNISGGALVLGMLAGLAAVPRKWRELYVLAAVVGVVLTVSRGALLGMLVAGVCLLLGGEVSRRRLLLVFAAACLVIAAGVQHWRSSGAIELLDNEPELFSRLSVGGSVGEENTESRLSFAAAGLRQFISHPVTGAGLGATDWEQGIGTHNIYVMHLAEHGVLGALIVPGLLLLLVNRAWTLRRQPLLFACAAFVACWGFFSHNVLDEFHHLLIFSLILAPHRVVQQVWGVAAAPSGRRWSRPTVCTLPSVPVRAQGTA
jgi:O-Antigen ligase